ncbi:hypothetical protein HK099_008486 [Clydaea vesicula]|uniref:C2H2-type domain-containing protein n=1 Tax=Clydaea vesicula TaxID=447962 RepID=A0AAD5XVU3_9FUNG|nr:hypothetical protein HK099_008486 [Clydaea vesicula]
MLFVGCAKVFDHEAQTYEHCLQAHSLAGKQLCQWVSNHNFAGCGYKMNHKGQLRDHLIMHFSTDFRPLQCSICLKNIRSRQELNRHVKSHFKASDNENSCESAAKSEISVNDSENITNQTSTEIENKNLNKKNDGTAMDLDEDPIIFNDNNNNTSLVDDEAQQTELSDNLKDLINESLNSHLLFVENLYTIISNQNNERTKNNEHTQNISLKNQKHTDFAIASLFTKNLEVGNNGSPKIHVEQIMEHLKYSLSRHSLLLPINPSSSCVVGTNLGIFWTNYDKVLEKLQIAYTDDIKVSLTDSYIKDGAMGRIGQPSKKYFLDALVSSPNYSQNECINCLVEIVPNSIKLLYTPFFINLSRALLGEIKNIFKDGLTIKGDTSFLKPTYNPNFPFKRLLMTIGETIKSCLEGYLTNEDTLNFYEPTVDSPLYRHPSDCTAAALLMNYKQAFPSVAKYNKIFLQSLKQVLKLGVDEIVKKLIYSDSQIGKICRKTCCFGFLCSGAVRFNWDIFCFEDESFIWFRLGVDENFILSPIKDLDLNFESVKI